MSRCALLVLMLLAMLGCARTPTPPRELTPEEEQRYEADLKRRIEREGEGSARRAERELELDEESATKAKKKR